MSLEIGARLSMDASGANQAVGSFKKQLREASEDLVKVQSSFGGTSKQAIEAAKKVAELRDRIGDARALSDAFDKDKPFQAFGQSIQGVVGGFSAMQGVMGLVGSEGEELQKIMLKVQSAMALSQGLDSLMAARDGFKNMAGVVGGVLSKAFGTLKAAIASTGIGVLLIALGAVVAYWSDIKSAVTGVGSAQKKLADEAAKHATIEEQKLDHLDSQENVLKLQGKSEREILQIKIKQVQSTIDAKVEQLKLQEGVITTQVEAAKRNKSILQGILTFMTAPLQLLINTVAKVASFFGADWSFNIADSVSSMVFDPEEIQKEGDAAKVEIQKQLDELKNTKAGYQLSIRDMDKKALTDRKGHLDKVVELERQIAEKVYEIHTEASKMSMEDIKKNMDETFLKIDALIKPGIKKQAGEDKVSGELAQSGKTQEQIQLETLAKHYEDRMKLVAGNKQLENQLTEEYETQKTEIERTHANQRLSIVAGVLGRAADLFGKQTAAGKALAIAQAVMNTYTGATEALRGKVPLPEPFATGVRIANAGLIIATGLKSIREISKTKVPGGGGGGMSIPSISTSTSMPIQPSQGTQLQGIRNQINAQGNQANRTFVVESDITNNQERIRRINRAARIG